MPSAPPSRTQKSKFLISLAQFSIALLAITLWDYIFPPGTTKPASLPQMATTLTKYGPLNPALFNASLTTSLLTTWFAPLPRHATGPTPALMSRWFGFEATAEAKSSFDATCRTLFLPALSSISASELPLPPFTSHASDRKLVPVMSALFRALPQMATDDEVERTDAALALILLLDQMPRNIFRGAEAGVVYEHYDRLARAMVYAMVSGSESKDFPSFAHNGLADLHNLHKLPSLAHFPVRKSWLFLPLMHSESLDDHEMYTSQVQEMKAEAEARGDADGATWAQGCLGFEDRHRVIIEKFGRYPYRNKVLGRESTKEEMEWLAGGADTFGAG